MTGGNIAVVALGSTGCSIECSSSPSADTPEFDLSRLAVVFCVSALASGLANLEEILPRCLTEDCGAMLAHSSPIQSFYLQLSACVAFLR